MTVLDHFLRLFQTIIIIIYTFFGYVDQLLYIILDNNQKLSMKRIYNNLVSEIIPFVQIGLDLSWTLK